MKDKKELGEVWEYINEFEYDYNLYDFKIFGYPIWNGCKEKAIDFMMGNSIKTMQNRKITIKKIKYITIRTIDALMKLPFIKPVDVLFVSSSLFRRGDGISKNSHIYFDNIIDELSSEIKAGFIEYPTLSEFDLNYRKSRHSDLVIPIDIFIPLSLIAKLVRRKEIKQSNREVDLLFKNENSKFDKHLIDNVSLWMKSLAEDWIIWTFALKWIYKRMSPQVVVDIANAGRFSQSVLGDIKRLEIQHGIIHKFHPGYSFSQYGKKHFQKFNKDKHLILYSDYYRNVVKEYGATKEENMLVIDNMKFWDFNFKQEKEIYKMLNLSQEKKIIILSSQPLEEAQIKFKEFIEYFHKIQNRNIALKDYVIVVKLHPRENIEISEYKKYEEDIIIVSGTISLLDLLNVSRVHIGYTSTVIEEAADFNLLNLILNDSNIYDKFGHLIETGKAKVINELDEVENYILNNDKSIYQKSVNISLDKNPYCYVNLKIKQILKENCFRENSKNEKTL